MTDMIDGHEVRRVLAEADCLYNTEQVEASITDMARAIEQRLADDNPLVLCVVIGGIILTGKLLPQLNFPLELDYIHATRYRGDITGKEIEWRVEPAKEMQGRTVLVIDDILDEGNTLAAIVQLCQDAGASQVCTAVLVEKNHDRKADIKADFVGLQTEDRYLFGYGMDYKDQLRNAPGIYAVKGL
jgi:hypoxanthine phosphoribosyltransferase